MPTHKWYSTLYNTYLARYLVYGHYDEEHISMLSPALHLLCLQPLQTIDRKQKGNAESPTLLHLIIYQTALQSTIQCYIEKLKPHIQALVAYADAWSPSYFVSDTFQWH